MHPIVKQKIEAGHCICAPRGLSVDPRCPIHKNQASNAERARYGMEHPLSAMCGCAKCQAAFKAEADARGVRACDDASAWWALVMGAAASIEDAANCLRDPDAKKQADGAAKHYREAAQKLWAARGVLGTQGGQSNG